MSKWKKIGSLILATTIIGTMFVGCGDDTATGSSDETIVLRILENDTAKKEGYLQF